ncbi:MULTISPECIES: hypothetical protein [Streptomycetaceae]|uniref:Uncharacterized protein n=1 Tax=Streptantibioticus cattleyicolor (strain ATCC 35852 / DSM 46488 / JCM 4925 / NBRC 14057 / NRRL 8057) TaxID=1003195 RepID=F8JT35_STREN|nr:MULTISPECIES: hypothetical protein [Streptomycetaceae]AEW92970.1 hypothetical protein SCATT_05990 [Streptantibioticus cattleyicolor NRRL 8057 = DSM 46488]MYS57713.1 hypothetical protein [Streptomyces sp. SID5468]CCB73331.1 protein of unknown function [Streptantibioticus cattleyicolor NRRL 8057 = DSM 46488]
MPYAYVCPVCGITSRPYLTHLGAERHGWRHRGFAHWGDYPDGEHVRRVSWIGPQRRDAAVVTAVVAGLLIAAFLSRWR